MENGAQPWRVLPDPFWQPPEQVRNDLCCMGQKLWWLSVSDFLIAATCSQCSLYISRAQRHELNPRFLCATDLRCKMFCVLLDVLRPRHHWRKQMRQVGEAASA